jgi:cytochrome d ubiquinol oxidase subunit II
MFENLSHLALQQYWWVIVSLLAAILVFLMFVQGGQTFILNFGKTKEQKTLLVNSLGRKWEFTFTTLVTFGGAFFASFPLFYSTSFGGAYWVWMLILAAFVIQAIAYEFRSKENNLLGSKTYEVFLLINGALGTILLGTAIATFFTGSEFYRNEFNFSQWKGAAYGLELALDISRYETFINLSLGVAVFFLARVLGLMYFMNNINNKEILKRSKEVLFQNAVLFLVFFLFFLVNILVRKGFAYDPVSGEVYLESFKYFHNLIEMPFVLILLLLGIVLVLFSIYRTMNNFDKFARKAIWIAGPGVILTVLSLLLIAGFNNTAFYPAIDPYMQSSLTIENASSSRFTLTVMSYVSLLVPFVIAYIWWAWRVINRKQISEEELEEEHHVY